MTLDYASTMGGRESSDAVLPVPLPDYAGGGLVNLMSSIATGRGGQSRYPGSSLLQDIDLARFRTVLLFVVDGLGQEYLQTHFGDSVIASHVRGRMTSVFPTTTAAAITTVLTGLAPAQHGLTGWYVWLDEISTLTAVLPFETRLGREPLSARGYDIGLLLDARPIYPRLDVDCHVVSPARIAHSPFNRAFSRGATIHAFDTLDACVDKIAGIVGSGAAQRYIYAYWPDLDHLGHECGIESKQAKRHFSAIDAQFARLLRQLENTDTLVLLTADHGIIDTSPNTHVRLQHHPALTAMLDVPLCGEPRAAYCYVHAGESGAFENYMATELGDEATVVPSTSLLEQGVFGPGKPHPRLRGRIGDYTVLMNDNYAISDTVSGETPSSLIGVHGGLTETELFVPLAVVET